MNISDSGFDSGSSPEIHMEDPPMSRTHQYRKVCHYLFVKLFYIKLEPLQLLMTLTFEDAPLFNLRNQNQNKLFMTES